MDNKDLLEKIESLEKRLSELESQKKNNLSMFGRSYAQVGNSDSDFLIKTKGQVKIQWGSKFIDIIKDGKINVDTNFIFTAKNSDKLGVKDGIYLVNDGSVYLKVGETILNLNGEVGTTYVSFLEEQETTAEQKYTAMQNIGFIYKDLNSISGQSLKNGIIYVESNQKLYIVQDGSLSEFTIAFPNPFTKQFIIAKSDSNKGALLIRGQGVSNSLAFEKLFIYNEYGNSYVDSDGTIYFRVGSSDKMVIDSGGVTFSDPVMAPMFQSSGATGTSGFRLYVNDKQSTLEVDNLIVRNSSDSSSSSQSVMSVMSVQWYSKNNIIKNIEAVVNPENPEEEGYQAELVYENQYQVGDSLYAYATVESENSSKQIKIPFTVASLDTEQGNTLYVKIDQEVMESPDIAGASVEELVESLRGQVTFLVGSNENPETILRRSEAGIDLIESSNFEDESNKDSIKTRLGDLTELGLKESNQGEDVDITGPGIYSKQAYFDKASYVSPYDLLEEDDSTKLASTEWTRKLLKNMLPTGTIIAYHGDDIPVGWAICDGDNGTPDLIGKFIKADVSEGDGDEVEITPLDTQEGVDPLTVKISPTYYSLIFIMKIQ